MRDEGLRHAAGREVDNRDSLAGAQARTANPPKLLFPMPMVCATIVPILFGIEFGA